MTDDHCLRPEFVDECLRGSPYSLPLDADAMPEVQRTLAQAVELNDQARIARNRIVQEMRGLLGINARSREIFESNRIEGVGTADLRGTVRILRGPIASAVQAASNRFDLVRAIDADDRTRDVLGLHAAKLFAEELVADPTRPLTEIDLRSMHQQILGSQSGSGHYRGASREFRIANADHVPPEFWEVPARMGELVSWVRGATHDAGAPSIFVAAVAHAWLTHIHPFTDGNGRMARLWANMVLAPTPLPALIIKHQPDRGHYLDALALSDTAGEIAPLVAVFMRALRRGVREMQDPEFAIQLFENEIARRNRGAYEQWFDAINAWTTDVAVLLRPLGFELTTIGVLDSDTFARYSQGEQLRAVVLCEVTSPWSPGSRAMLVLRRPRELAARAQGFPAIHFYRRKVRTTWSPGLYERVQFDVDELVVRPSSSNRHRTILRMSNGRIREGVDRDLDPFVDALTGAIRAGRFIQEW